MVCVDSWLGMFCEYNLISHESAFSTRQHPLKVVTLFVSDFSMGCQTWYFIINVIICHFSGGGTVMWTTTHRFDFLQTILSQYVQNYRPTPEQTNILLDQLQKHFFLVVSHVPGGGLLLLQLFA